MEDPSEGKLAAVEGRKQASCMATRGRGGPEVACCWEVKLLFSWKTGRNWSH